MMHSDTKKPRSLGALTPSMGAMSRSYRTRSGGLANELCLLGREEVPSLVGDMALLTKLVMLWQLLGREGPGINKQGTGGQAGTRHSPSAPVPGKGSWRLHSSAKPSPLLAPPLLPPFR